MVLVCDAAALLELARCSLLPQLLRLPLVVSVADVLCADPRFDLNGLDWARLRRLGLREEAVDGRGVAMAVACQADWPMLSSHDCFSIALAAQRGWPLLTGHGCLAAAALGQGIEVRDLRWLAAQMTAIAPGLGRHTAARLTPACQWRRDGGDDCPSRRATCPPAAELSPA